MTNHSSSLPLPLCSKATTLELNSPWPLMNAFFKMRTSCQALAWARDAFERHRLEGSPEKAVVAERRFKAAGAEVDSREAVVDLGLVTVSAPLAKRVGLSTLSLRAARLRWISNSLLPGWLAIGSPLSFIGVAGRVSLRSSSPSLPSVNASLRMPSSHFQETVLRNSYLLPLLCP